MKRTITTGIEEEQIQIIKRRRFKIPKMDVTANEDTVLVLDEAGRRSLMELMARDVYRAAEDFHECRDRLNGLQREMDTVIKAMLCELDEVLPFH